ncbi:MAG: hypothetical protein OXU61_11920 [Gammaproteobacteria bacterium]|nr:hypothetical protein [Gammaproteobacteria bacterium]
MGCFTWNRFPGTVPWARFHVERQTESEKHGARKRRSRDDEGS